jgi:putative glutamine amidotransferase
VKCAPTILVSTSNELRGVEFADRSASLSHHYVRAVMDAGGGLPVLAPVIPEAAAISEWVHRADGVMLTGGDDLQPDLYNPNLPASIKAKATGVDPHRDLFDFLLIEQAMKQRKPLLAICRGPQVLNVALGGGLITDIPTEASRAMNHQRKPEAHRTVHTVELVSGSLMRRIHRCEKLKINSAHHQAVGELAPMLRATASTRDGIIEAIELTVKEAKDAPFLLGVQYHPERLYEKHPVHARLFRAFIKAAA